MRMFVGDENGNEVEIFNHTKPREEKTIELQTTEVEDAADLSLNLVMGFSSSGTQNERNNRE